MEIFEIFKEIGIAGIIDILCMSALIYAVLVWIKRKRVAFVLTGIIIFALIYLVSYQFNLFLISSVLQAFFAVILIAIIIIFQEELRYFFEQIAVWSFRRKIVVNGSVAFQAAPDVVDTLVRTVHDLAHEKIGALIVLKGKDAIMRHLVGGVELNGDLSEAVLKSILDPHSIGHDGAVVIDEGRIFQFGCHLPLSKNFKILRGGGTRHAAALGLAELSDALCLVVSEERGTISVARNGEMFVVPSEEELTRILRQFHAELNPPAKRRTVWDIFVKNYREKIIALVMTLALWFVLVHESQLVRKNYFIPVEYPPLAGDLLVSAMEPEEVMVTFSGPRSAFRFMNEKNIRLALRLMQAKEGPHVVRIANSDLIYPREVVLENISPRSIKVQIGKKE